MSPHPVVIIGSGLAGASLGHLLSTRGINTVLYDKARGPGGRASCRRLGSARYHLGLHTLEHWQIDRISQAAPGIGTRLKRHYQSPLGSFRSGPVSFVRELLASTDCYYGEKLVSISTASGVAELSFESGRKVKTQSVVLTMPLPQVSELLEASGLETPGELAQAEYMKQITFLSSKQLGGKELNASLEKKLDNRSLGLTQESSLSYLLSRESSDAYLDSSDDEIKQGLSIDPESIHRWRYARCSRPVNSHSHFVVSKEPRILVCGDGFLSGDAHSSIISAASTFREHFET